MLDAGYWMVDAGCSLREVDYYWLSDRRVGQWQRAIGIMRFGKWRMNWRFEFIKWHWRNYQSLKCLRKPVRSVAPRSRFQATSSKVFGRKRYKNDFIRFLIYALASCDETRDHVEFLYETGSLKDESIFQDLGKQYDILGKKINTFLKRVIEQHLAPKEVSGQ